MRIHSDLLHLVIECLDATSLIAASQVSGEWYNICMTPKYWRNNYRVHHPDFFPSSSSSSSSSASTLLNHKDRSVDNHALWKVNEKRYNNNPRQLILDRNNNNVSVHHRWAVTNWSQKILNRDRLRSPKFMVGGVQFQILCYPAGNADGQENEPTGVSMYLMGERTAPPSRATVVRRRNRRRQRRAVRRASMVAGGTTPFEEARDRVKLYVEAANILFDVGTFFPANNAPEQAERAQLHDRLEELRALLEPGLEADAFKYHVKKKYGCFLYDSDEPEDSDHDIGRDTDDEGTDDDDDDEHPSNDPPLPQEDEWSCCADFELTIVNQKDPHQSARWWSDAHHYQFSKRQTSWGRHSMLDHNDLYKKDVEERLGYDQRRRARARGHHGGGEGGGGGGGEASDVNMGNSVDTEQDRKDDAYWSNEAR